MALLLGLASCNYFAPAASRKWNGWALISAIRQVYPSPLSSPISTAFQSRPLDALDKPSSSPPRPPAQTSCIFMPRFRKDTPDNNLHSDTIDYRVELEELGGTRRETILPLKRSSCHRYYFPEEQSRFLASYFSPPPPSLLPSCL